MVNCEVEIIHEGNYYESMVGKVITEYPQTILVKIQFVNESHNVMFYKEQVEVIG